MSHVFFWEQQGVVVRYAGDIHISEIQQAQDQLHGDARIDSARYLIVDALAVTSIITTRSDEIDIWAYDAGASIRNPRLLKAFVATLDEFVRFVTWYNGMHRAPYPSRVFDTEADARRWLQSAMQIPLRNGEV